MWRQLDRKGGPRRMTGWMTRPQRLGAFLRRARSLPGRAARAGPLAAGLRALPSLLMSKAHIYSSLIAPCLSIVHSSFPRGHWQCQLQHSQGAFSCLP